MAFTSSGILGRAASLSASEGGTGHLFAFSAFLASANAAIELELCNHRVPASANPL
nr:MAG TPA: hypothetical protein [Caudoviricetes sp.]